MRIAFVTCGDLSRYFPSKDEPLFTRDDHAAVQYLRSQGHLVEALPWGASPQEAINNFDVLVIRSPWDYSESPEKSRRFMAWTEALADRGAKVLNEPQILKWNLDKHYLTAFAEAGVPIVPTRYVEPSSPLCVELLEEYRREWDRVVVKPCVSAGARDTFLIETGTRLDEPLQSANGYMPGDWTGFQGERSFMVQPFLEEVRTGGEWSLLFYDGVYSHSVRKLPKAGGWLVQDELGGSLTWQPAPDNVVRVAKLAIERLPAAFAVGAHGSGAGAKQVGASLLYARVDVIETAGGALLGELELVEPELFFLNRTAKVHSPYLPALELFSRGLIKRVNA